MFGITVFRNTVSRNPRRYFSGVALVIGLALFLTPTDLFSGDRNKGDKGKGEKPNLTGTWSFNPDGSDDLREKMREARQGRQRGGRGGGGGRGGRGGSGGGYPGGGGRGGSGGGYPGGGGSGGGGTRMPDGGWPGGGGSDGDRQRDRQGNEGREGRRGGLMFDYLRPAQEIVIRHDEPEIFITKDERIIHERFTDGRKEERDSGDGSTVEVTTRWKKRKLVTAIVSERAGKIIEAYELDPEKNQLVVTVRIENRRMGTVKVRYVYDADTPSSEPVTPDSPAEDPTL